jgi:hypothetical protein
MASGGEPPAAVAGAAGAPALSAALAKKERSEALGEGELSDPLWAMQKQGVGKAVELQEEIHPDLFLNK